MGKIGHSKSFGTASVGKDWKSCESGKIGELGEPFSFLVGGGYIGQLKSNFKKNFLSVGGGTLGKLKSNQKKMNKKFSDSEGIHQPTQISLQKKNKKNLIMGGTLANSNVTLEKDPQNFFSDPPLPKKKKLKLKFHFCAWGEGYIIKNQNVTLTQNPIKIPFELENQRFSVHSI